MARKSTVERNARTNRSIRAKRKSIYSFRSYAAIGSRVPFRYRFPCHGTAPWGTMRKNRLFQKIIGWCDIKARQKQRPPRTAEQWLYWNNIEMSIIYKNAKFINSVASTFSSVASTLFHFPMAPAHKTWQHLPRGGNWRKSQSFFRFYGKTIN